MARFYGSMKSSGSKSNTKMGQNHIEAHIRTWDHGIYVAYKVLEDGRVLCSIWRTGGSNDATKHKLIKEFKIAADKAPNKRPGIEAYGAPLGNLVLG